LCKKKKEKKKEKENKYTGYSRRPIEAAFLPIFVLHCRLKTRKTDVEK
jgi:hypothetical protein